MATVREGNKAVLLVVDVQVVAMTWLSYPGRTNGTATAEAVSFETPGGAR